jgi:SAM-dependent methyltransferase
VSDAAQRLARARGARSRREVRDLYAAWAPHYDADVFGALGIVGTDRIAALLADVVDDDPGPVLDLGCGTGAAGRGLRERGVAAVDGLDLSPEMLAVARSTGAYRALVVADLTAPLPFVDGAYAAGISAGTFTTGHVGPVAVREAARVLRPGGVLAAVVADAVWAEFDAPLADAFPVVLHRSVEPVRRDGPAESVFLVARRR